MTRPQGTPCRQISRDLPPRYLATMNTPGYLPWSDDRMLFDTVQAAWEYLEAQRNEQWNDTESQGPDYDPVMGNMGILGKYGDCGTVYGSTPGNDGSHDLGIAYTVTKVEHASYPHEPDTLYDCDACDMPG